MRKISALILAALMILSFSACKKNDTNLSSDEIIVLSREVTDSASTSFAEKPINNSKSVQSSSKKVESKVTTDKTGNSDKKSSQSTVANATVKTYRDLSGRSIRNDDWRLVRIKNPATNITLRTNMPNDWDVSKSSDSTYNIIRNGKTIGTFTTASLEKAEESYEIQSKETIDIKTKKQINRYKRNGQSAYYWYFEFVCSESGKKFTVKMRINYTELDESAADTILYNSFKAPKENSFTPLSKSNGSKEILILGNSFIGTSQIGGFLSDMFHTSGSGYTVNAVSRGMAQVHHYAADTEMCNTIRSGRYSYVFLCGFYSSEAVNAVSTIKAACEASDTILVIFPAHNENAEKIDLARNHNSELYVLDWKGEINALIDWGIDRSDFCVADIHNHSTPLAGYVGANMIYRSLFGTAPRTLTSSAPLSSAEVNTKLAEYVRCGGSLNTLLKNYYEIK